jgi:hypothetical protein
MEPDSLGLNLYLPQLAVTLNNINFLFVTMEVIVCCWSLTPIILASQEAEIMSIEI